MCATAAAVVVLLADGGAPGSRVAAAASITPLARGQLQFYPRIAIGGSHAPAGPAGGKVWKSRRLPSTGADVSFDLSLPPGGRVLVGLGDPATGLLLSRDAQGTWFYAFGAAPTEFGLRLLWPDHASLHVEVTLGADPRVALDGRIVRAPTASSLSGRLSLQALAGSVAARAMVISPTTDHAALLLHRLTELHARLVAAASPLIGASRSDRLHLGGGWMSGFWPGALWQAGLLEPRGGLFARWARAATLAHLGHERAATHDQGFMYGESSLAAWRAQCRGQDQAAPSAVCGAFARSVLTAADTLVALARTNPVAGTIPTTGKSPLAETIIDSMMNLGILTWASRYTHRPEYARLAARHAHVVASLLVRPDGSTYQAVHFDRSAGAIVFLGTHQGLSDTSTWARGEGWGLYGFSETAAELGDRDLLRVALRIADYVARRVPATGVPLWDYDAAPGAPVDVSAATVTAAGMFHLAIACRRLPGVCSDRAQWVAEGRTLLDRALQYASVHPPLGLLGSQQLDLRRHTCCNGGEIVFGLTYALEALRLEQTVS